MAIMALGAAVWVGAGTTGIISGVVKSAEDGKPLSGANVIVTGTKLTTVTDANGYYAITNVPPGDYEVRVEMVGFANGTSDKIQVTMDSTATVGFDLKQQAIQEAAVVISRPRSMIAADQVNTLNQINATQESFTRTDPTSNNTVPGVLSTLPGVVIEPNGTGLIHIRGGKPEQIGYYIEGIPMTDPNMGSFSDNLFSTGVSKFQVYTGGFGAEFGNALGCVLNEVKKTGDANQGLHMTSYAGDEYYRNAIAEIGGGSPDGFNYYASSIIQRNDFSGTPILKSQTYDDSVAKLVWPGKKDTVTVLGLTGTLQGDVGPYFPADGDFMRQKYSIAGAIWSHNFNPSSFITVRPYYIHVGTLQSFVHSGPVWGMGGAYWLTDASDQAGLTASYTNQLNGRQLLKLGASVLKSDNNQTEFMGEPWAANDTNTFQSSLYAEEQVKFAEKWTANFGGRYDGITYDRKTVGDATQSDLMPRLGLSYAADSRTAWKASWGRYMKFVPANSIETIFLTPADAGATSSIGSTDPQKATTGDLSFERQLNDSLACRVTPFYSNYTHLGSLSPDQNQIMRYADLGKAQSRGVEFLLRKKVSQNWQGWFSYTHATIKADDSGTGKYSYTSWDRRNMFSLVADYKAGKWAHTLRADMGSGLADVYPGEVGSKRAGDYAILTYGLTVDLPKGSSIGDSLNVTIYNLLDNRQVAEYEAGAANRTTGFFYGARQLSMGLNKSF